MAMFKLHRHGAAQAAVSSPRITAGGPTSGPGWYDSSWELRQGLVVREGLPPDARLHEWLEHHVRSEPSVLPAGG